MLRAVNVDHHTDQGLSGALLSVFIALLDLVDQPSPLEQVLGPGVAVLDPSLQELLMEVPDVPLVIRVLIKLNHGIADSLRSAPGTGAPRTPIQKRREARVSDDVFPSPDGAFVHAQNLGGLSPGDGLVTCFLKDFLDLHCPLPLGWGIDPVHGSVSFMDWSIPIPVFKADNSLVMESGQIICYRQDGIKNLTPL